eukprot:728144-Pyramimonas_sp.AAC.1
MGNMKHGKRLHGRRCDMTQDMQAKGYLEKPRCMRTPTCQEGTQDNIAPEIGQAACFAFDYFQTARDQGIAPPGT